MSNLNRCHKHSGGRNDCSWGGVGSNEGMEACSIEELPVFELPELKGSVRARIPDPHCAMGLV